MERDSAPFAGHLLLCRCRLDEKLRKLDEQLIKHREVIKRTRPGPAQDAAKRRALNVRPMQTHQHVCAHVRLLTTPSCLCKVDARQVLKQKRLYETQRDQLYNQQFNVEQTAFVMENVQDSVQTVQAMKAASKELRTAFKKNELNISGIEKLQDDMADLMVCLQAVVHILMPVLSTPA